MRSSKRVTIFDQSFHEWKGRPVWQVGNSQCRRRGPIIALERITCWDGSQRISSAEFQLWIGFTHSGSEIDNLLLIGVMRFMQIGVGIVIVIVYLFSFGDVAVAHGLI